MYTKTHNKKTKVVQKFKTTLFDMRDQIKFNEKPKTRATTNLN